MNWRLLLTLPQYPTLPFPAYFRAATRDGAVKLARFHYPGLVAVLKVEVECGGKWVAP